MKRIFYTAFLTVFLAAFSQAQQRSNMMKQQLAPEQRRANVMQARENMMVEGLNVEGKNEEQFRKMYSDYQESQRAIKEKFQSDFDPDKLSDKEAQEKLDESFELGEKLLENRKNYARKMQTVLRPQQVLKMFRTEGMMRDKIMNRRSEGQNFNENNRTGNEGFRGGRK